ncbi:ABC transporter permease [Streptomyces sp. JJ36]|nr:ABC transporter permease [Streptomyces sp. JJ36]
MPWKREARDAALTGLGVALLGVVLGLLWLWLAPRVPLISDGEAVYLKRPEGEEAIGADGTFVLLGLGLGAVAGAVAFLVRRNPGVGPALGLALGGLAGSLLAWWLGTSFGPTDDLAAHAREVGEGNVFDGPLELHAKGALLALPFAAVGVHLACTALFGKRDAAPVPPPAPW